MTKKSETGNFGEGLACEYLQKNGYRIIERNFRKPWGELDIIAKAKDKTIVFVEVKTMKTSYSRDSLRPEDNLSYSKLKKLQKTAMLYIGSHQGLVKKDKGWKIDLIAIDLINILQNPPLYNLRHLENITL